MSRYRQYLCIANYRWVYDPLCLCVVYVRFCLFFVWFYGVCVCVLFVFVCLWKGDGFGGMRWSFPEQCGIFSF